ncbi:hypothetical protein [Roseivivax marinus]|uniref:hypothetical protein n=1 Tax=Roseivivax marinus TaxID=1379903 RepID=UPI00273EA2F4|nr:hypothetical protein [Roseivivax marinus]
MENSRSLVELPRALSEAGYESATYRQLYTAAVDGVIPARQGKNKRWTFEVADLPVIAEAMNLCDAHAA